MRYPFAEMYWTHGSTSKMVRDPRVAVASHIGWTKPYEKISDFKFPEPDHYNHAIYTQRPIECKFINSQVFYRPRKETFWWSLYHVTLDQTDEFMSWLQTLQVRIYWRNERELRDRERKTLLWHKKNAAALTDNENLYLTGYYDEFKSKYLGDCATEWIQNHLGVPRQDIHSVNLVYEPDPEDQVIV